MKQKGKLLTCILCVMLGICCVLGFSSCKKDCKSGHTWGEWSVTKAATCVEEGERVHTCTKCKTAETEKIGALGHDWAEATCVAPKTCKRCSATEGEPLAHTFDKEVANESTLKSAATCTAKAVYYKTCACGAKSETETFEYGEPLAHTFDQEVANEKTLKSAGSCDTKPVYYRSCKCGAVDTNADNTFEGVANGHAFEKKSETQATCTEPGKTVYRCKSCGTEETRVSGSALGHKWVAATCTTAEYCSVCKKEGVPALGHTWEYSAEESIEATCYAVGKDVTKCSVCGETHTDVVPKTAHNFGELTPTNETPSMGTADVCHVVYIHTCQNDGCGFSEKKEVEVSEHNFSKQITTAATCSQNGQMTYTCNQCGFVKTEAYADATAHNYVTNAAGTQNECDICHAVQLLASGESAEVKAADLKNAGSIRLDNASISLSDEAKGVLEGKDNVNVGAAPLSGSDLDKALAALGTNYEGSQPTVYNFTMSSGGTAITEFGGKVTVRIPYTLSEGEDPNEIVVAYINGDKVEEVLARYDSGFAIFETEHFSYYTVTRMTPAQRCAKFGHVNRTVTQEPNCTTPGYTISVCVRCGETTKNEKKEALGHDYEVTEVKATCTVNGKKTYKCKRCNDEFNMTLFAEGHDWTETAKVEATCKNPGSATYKCDKCSEEFTVTEPQKDHAVKSTVVLPTCTQRGYTEIACVMCDYKSIIDYKDALGHSEKTKVFLPTCTEEGYTLVYCERCNAELNKKDIVAAKGHTMVNGVCSVCGEGCEHNYVKGNVVAATCTENGYTVYTCSKCNTSYNGDEVKALGHKFNVEKCERCGIANPELTDYYANMLRSVKDAMNLKIRLEGLKIDLTSKFEIARKDNGQIVYTESDDTPDFLKQVGVNELALSIADNGEISGYASIDILQEGTEYKAKAVIKDGFVYVIAENPDGNEVSFAVAGRMSIDSVLSEMFHNMPKDVTYETIKNALVWVNTDLNAVLDNLLTSNKTAVGSAMASLIPYVFERTETDSGYTYTLDVSKLKKAVDEFTSDDLTISKAIDKVLGNGTFDNAALFIPVLLDKKPAEAIGLIKKLGIDREQICSAVDSVYFILTGEKLDSSAYIDNALEQFKDMTVAEVIAAASGSEGATAEDVKTMVSTNIKMMRETALVDLLFSFDKNAERDENGNVKPEYKKAMLDGVKKSIDGLAEMMKTASVSFSTNKDGFVKNIVVELKEFDYSNKFGGNIEENRPSEELDSEIARPITDTKNTHKSMLSGKLTIELGATYDDSEYASLIEQINGEIPSFGNNNVVTINEEDYKSEPDESTGVIETERKDKTLIYIDADGKIFKMTTEGRYVYREYSPYYGKGSKRYAYFVETETIYSIVYNTSSDAILAYTSTACGNSKMYTIDGEYVVKGSTKRTLLKYRMANDGSWILESSKVLSNRKNLDNEWQFKNRIPTRFYFDSETKTFSLNGGHAYELDETKSDVRCGGKEVYVCRNCKHEMVKKIEHLSDKNGKEYEKEYKKLLEGDEYSCQDGVKVIERCPDCKAVVEERIMRGHPYEHNGESWQFGSGNKFIHYEYELNGKTCRDGITRREICDICGKVVGINRDYGKYHKTCEVVERYHLTDYGSKCGGYLTVYACPCGERCEYVFERGDDRYVCEIGHNENPIGCWITDENILKNIVEGRQYNLIDGSYHFDNSYFVLTCAVTDSEVPGQEGPCGFKIRVAKYWLKEEGTCIVKMHTVLQLGYNETDGTYKKQVEFVSGEKVYHSLKALTDGDKNEGYEWKCSLCGSYMKTERVEKDNGYIQTSTWVNNIDLNDLPKKSVYEFSSEFVNGESTNKGNNTRTYFDGTTTVETSIDKYDCNNNQIFYRWEFRYRDGRTEWRQEETVTETYTDTDSFGKAVEATRISRINSDSNGRYDVTEYAYADYRKVLNLAEGVEYDGFEYYRLRYYDYVGDDGRKGSMRPWALDYYFENVNVGKDYLIYCKTVNGDSFIKYTFVYNEKPCTFTITVSTENGEMSYYDYKKADALEELLMRSGCKTYEEVVERYKERYGVDDPTEEDVYRFFDVKLPSENSVYNLCGTHHFYKLDQNRSVEPTCTQYGKAVYVCVVCGDEVVVDAESGIYLENYDLYPHGHNWTYVSENLYRCDRCGLENRNGADGDVIFEDLTEKYGDGSEYVIGFHDRANEGFTVYVSLIKKNVAEGEDNELITDYKVSYDYDGKAVLKVNKAAIKEIAAGYGLADGEYDVRVTFVPKNEGKDLDYAITLTDNSSESVSEEQWRAAFATEKFENYSMERTKDYTNREPSVETIKIKFVENGLLVISLSNNIIMYHDEEESATMKAYYAQFYSVLLEKYSDFTFDKTENAYIATVDITLTETSLFTTVTTIKKVVIDEGGNVTSIVCDYVESLADDVTSSGNIIMKLTDYGTTVITAEEIEAAQKANV